LRTSQPQKQCFDETARKDGPLIKSVVAYDELVREMAVKTAGAKS